MKKCIVCKAAAKPTTRKSGYLIYRCLSCGMIFVNPDQVDPNYQEQYIQNLSSPLDYYRLTYGHDFQSFSQLFEIITGLFKAPGLAIDIGCNTGAFGEVAAINGWIIEGLEPNRLIYQHLKQRFPKQRFFNGFLDQKFVRSAPGRFDLVFSSDVIEHVSDPVQFLELAKGLLKPDGLMVITTCDFDSLLTRMFQVKPTEHLIYLNKSNIRELYRRAGLKISQVSNFHRYRNLAAMPYSTTYTDKNNYSHLMPGVKLSNRLKIDGSIEFLLQFFKEDLMIIAKR